MKSKNIIIFLLLFISDFCNSQRIIVPINDKWYFTNKEAQRVDELDDVSISWQKINLPHTWNTDAYQTQYYQRRSCWYKKELTVPSAWHDKNVSIKFEGVNSYAEVYCNGKLVATHAGGYGAFVAELNSYLFFDGRKNSLLVKVNNENKEIPPLSGDFTIFGGIYRDVNLIVTPSSHFLTNQFGAEHILVSTPEVSENNAKVFISGKIFSTKGEGLLVEAKIRDNSGKTVVRTNIPVEKGKSGIVSFQSKEININHPKLWSPDAPNLYAVDFILKSVSNNLILDKLTQPLGLRWFGADSQNGFVLNGKPTKLMGVCRHQDKYPFGIALSDSLQKKDMQLIKDMGANFVRLAHYQHNEAVLEACDSLGLLVWEEIPIVDIIDTTQTFRENAKTALQEMIWQHRRHPAVVIWGYMNEVIIQVPQRIKDESERNRRYEKTVTLAKELEALTKSEDSTRLTAMAFHGTPEYNRIGLSGITDIAGWNLYQGWYGGKFEDFDAFVDKEHEKYPQRPIIISEFGAGSDKRLQSFSPRVFDFSIQWQQQYLEHYLPAIMKRPFIIGASEWNFIDFSSASRQESMPHVNNKGLVYNDRTPKDVYFYFKAFLRKDIPVLHIAVDDWKERVAVSESDSSFNPIKVYSNLSKATLSVNGISFGAKDFDNFHAMWNVPLKEGKNRVEISGEFKGALAKESKDVMLKIVPKHLLESKEVNIAINAGSNCFFTSSDSCQYVPDQPYESGSWGFIGGDVFTKGERIGTTSTVENTQDVPLLQTMRNNPKAYQFDLPNGKYEIELLFADIDKPVNASAYTLSNDVSVNDQERIFNVCVNGKMFLENFCPAKTVGYNVAISKVTTVNVDNNQLIIEFEKVRGNPFINALKIRKIGL